MKEYVYGLRQKTGRKPVIKKLGAIKIGMEQTPVLFRGEVLLVESMGADAVCDCQYVRVRNLRTGEISAPFGQNYYFASAYAEDDRLYVFATSRHDDKPMTMYDTDKNAGEWHDCRGGHTVRVFASSDLAHWEEWDAVTCPEKRFWNTSVCRGDQGYVMAIEVSAEPGFETPEIGVAFTSFFATSPDLYHWEMMPDSNSYTPARYNACPALRFANGWYYMICLEALPCVRYAPYIYRTRNFADWEVGFHNPIMMWGDDDRVVHEGCTLNAGELDLLEHGLNINCSDLDLCEWNGQTHIFYANGDQMSYSFLCEALYDGPLDEFLEGFFK